MITNLTEISNFLKNKEICLLGNSRSILKNPKNIDSYDIICRINKGVPVGKEQFIGSRTDVLFLATRMEESSIKKFNSKFVVWTTNNKKLQSDWVKENAIQNPSEDWQELKSLFPNDKLPSTGLVTIQFLIKHADFKKLTIYGFDFFELSGTWYHNLKNQPWHVGKIEKKLILTWIKEKKNISLIIE